MREISIQKNEAGQRMDKFLAKYLNKAPKSFFYKMMRKKNITLNGKKAVFFLLPRFRLYFCLNGYRQMDEMYAVLLL